MRKKMSRKAYISGVLQGGSGLQIHPQQQIVKASIGAQGVETKAQQGLC
jgi:hypothetical protein